MELTFSFTSCSAKNHLEMICILDLIIFIKNINFTTSLHYIFINLRKIYKPRL